MKKLLLIAVLVISVFVVYNLWSTDSEAHRLIDGFTQAGVLKAYSCGDRTAPSITVSKDWATLRARHSAG
jgi:hypothetical protein